MKSLLNIQSTPCQPAVSTSKSSNYKDERYQNKIPISPAQTFSIPDLSKDFFENRRDLKSMPASLSSYDVFYSIIYNYEYSMSEGIAIDPSFFEKVKRNRFIQVLAKGITVDNILNIIRYRRFIMAHYRFSILSEPLGRCPICCGIGFDGNHISETVCSCIEYVTGKSLDELPQITKNDLILNSTPENRL